MKFLIIENPEESEINEIRFPLQQHNAPHWEVHERDRYIITVKEKEILTGGIVFTISGHWVELEYFWVTTEKRGQGFGKELLEKTESFARSKGCRMSFLNTFNFQAKPFYEKNGYKVVYTQKNFPVKSSRYFMEKNL